MIAAGVLLGVGVGAGLCLLAIGLWPAPPRLAAVLADYDAALRSPQPLPAPSSRWERTVGRPLAAAFSDRGWFGARTRSDLSVLALAPGVLFARKAGYALGGFLAPLLAVTAAAAVGARLPILVPAWLCLTGAAVGFVLPDLSLRTEATAARRNFRVAVGAFLDLVAMRMASGAGLAEALADAAQLGVGSAFAQLRGALADARTDGLSPAAALGRLGTQLAIPELVDTAARLDLVGSSGAQAEASLRAQAASMRDRELSDLRGTANERSQSMLVAQVVLGLGFLLFLGYPAVAKVLAA